MPQPMSPPIEAGLVGSLRGLARDGRLLFATRVLRMFGYGFLAVVLVLYLAALGLHPVTIGTILTLTLVGGTLLPATAPPGTDVGPFLAVEPAAPRQTTPGARRTPPFACYNLARSVATAFGALG